MVIKSRKLWPGVCAGLVVAVAAVWMFASVRTVVGGPEEDATLTKVGQTAPGFRVKTPDGKEFSLEAKKGRVVLLNFFATWCGPCMEEMPHVEKEVWRVFKDKGLEVIAIGREHSDAEVAAFQKKSGHTFAMAADPKREIYAKFATQYIPRTYLIGKDGKIVFQHTGFDSGALKELVAAIEKELGKTSP